MPWSVLTGVWRVPAIGRRPLRGVVQPARVGREGGLAGGRCKYVHVSSVAASMRLTPPANPPSRPRTVSCAPREDQKKKKNQKRKPILQTFVSTKVDIYQLHRTPSRQIAGDCRRRGGSGCGGVRGMDAAAKPPWTGSRRPPQPDPPRHPTGNPLLTLLWLLLRPLRVQGAALLPNPLSKPQPPARVPAPATPAAAPMPPAGHRPPESPRSPAQG